MPLRGSAASTADSLEQAEAPMKERQSARKMCHAVTESGEVSFPLLQNLVLPRR